MRRPCAAAELYSLLGRGSLSPRRPRSRERRRRRESQPFLAYQKSARLDLGLPAAVAAAAALYSTGSASELAVY